MLGDALGIAVLAAVELGYYYPALYDRLSARGIVPTAEQSREVHDFIVAAEQEGLRQVDESGAVAADLAAAHIGAFQLTFVVSAGIAVLGALACWLLVRTESRTMSGPVFGRRSRWTYVGHGRSHALTRTPPGFD